MWQQTWQKRHVGQNFRTMSVCPTYPSWFAIVCRRSYRCSSKTLLRKAVSPGETSTTAKKKERPVHFLMAAAVSSRPSSSNMPTRIGHSEPVQALTLDIPERPLSLAERGALAQKEFARLEAAHKKAMSLPKAQNGWSSSPNGTNHRTPRSAFDSRLAELADVTQRSHRTPRPTKVLGDTNPFVLQGPNMEDPVMCTGSLLHAYGGLGLRRGSNHGMSSRD